MSKPPKEAGSHTPIEAYRLPSGLIALRMKGGGVVPVPLSGSYKTLTAAQRAVEAHLRTKEN